MSIRNCGELGQNLQKIANRLLANDQLVKLLYYADNDPYNHRALTEQEKLSKVFTNLIKVVPYLGTNEQSQSMLAIYATTGELNENDEFRDITLKISVLTPLSTWMINDDNLRPFAIIGAIQDSLSKKRINGFGEIQGGNFSLTSLTDEFSIYEIEYVITNYD